MVEDRESGVGTGSVADADAVRLPRRGLSDGWNCCAEIVEDVRTAPRIVVVNAEVVRRKPRLLAFPGLALPDGSVRRGFARHQGKPRQKPDTSPEWARPLTPRLGLYEVLSRFPS